MQVPYTREDPSMASKSLLIDACDPNLRQKVISLATTPGYCIFIDIVGSTRMKQLGIQRWVAHIHNTFANAGLFLSTFRPLKAIGDELMYFVEESDMIALRESPLSLFDNLFKIAADRSESTPPTKIVAAYCTSVYPLTFFPYAQDYYGLDIDRTARIMGIRPALREREVAIDADFHTRLVAAYDATGNKEDFPSVRKLGGPCSQKVKGIPANLVFYRTGPL